MEKKNITCPPGKIRVGKKCINNPFSKRNNKTCPPGYIKVLKKCIKKPFEKKIIKLVQMEKLE